jgi:DNA-binding XRE family transcriptional regulator
MEDPQIIRTPSGEELVVLPRAEYEALKAAAEFDEDAADIAMFDERMRELAQDPNAKLPAPVTDAMLRGASLLKALRLWRGLPQTALAKTVGVGQGFMSDLESGRRRPSGEMAKKLAHALSVPEAWLEARPE